MGISGCSSLLQRTAQGLFFSATAHNLNNTRIVWTKDRFTVEAVIATADQSPSPPQSDTTGNTLADLRQIT